MLTGRCNRGVAGRQESQRGNTECDAVAARHAYRQCAMERRPSISAQMRAAKAAWPTTAHEARQLPCTRLTPGCYCECALSGRCPAWLALYDAALARTHVRTGPASVHKSLAHATLQRLRASQVRAVLLLCLCKGLMHHTSAEHTKCACFACGDDVSCICPRGNICQSVPGVVRIQIRAGEVADEPHV